MQSGDPNTSQHFSGSAEIGYYTLAKRRTLYVSNLQSGDSLKMPVFNGFKFLQVRVVLVGRQIHLFD